MNLTTIGRELEEWAQYYSALTVSSGADGVEVSNGGGETRFFVREFEHRVTVTTSSRMQPETFEMFSDDVTDAAKYLIDVFGPAVRSTLKLRFLMMPVELHQVNQGWTVSGVDRGWAATSDVTGRTATFNGDYLAVAFTHYGDRTADELRASYLDPKGRPYSLLDRVI